MALLRLGELLLGRGHQGLELLARKQFRHHPPVLAIRHASRLRRHSGGEAVGDPQPDMAPGQPPRPPAAGQDGGPQEGRLGGQLAGEGEGHGRGIGELIPEKAVLCRAHGC